MSDPILILGAPRAGASAVAGLLHEACGVSMGDLVPPTIGQPLGSYEAEGVVDAHRNLLEQMERDWTCPPSSFQPEFLDLRPLAEQVEIHRSLPGQWAVKDPQIVFLLRAWVAAGVERVRLVTVVRAPADNIRSLAVHDQISEDRAELILDAYLGRLTEISRSVDVPVIQFSADAVDVIAQVRDLAAAWQLEWDEESAQRTFETDVTRSAAQPGSTPDYEELLSHRIDPERSHFPVIDLTSIEMSSGFSDPLPVCLGNRYIQQRNELWDIAGFSSTPDPIVAEVVLEGSQPDRGEHPRVRQLHRVEVAGPVEVGARLMERRLRPHGVVAHGILAGHRPADIEFFFRSVYVNTHALAEIVVDAPSIRGNGLRHAEPEPVEHPTPATVVDIASVAGWDSVAERRLSPGRVGLVLRKRVLTDRELIPVVTDLLASLDRIHALDDAFDRLERFTAPGGGKSEATAGPEPASPSEVESLRRRARRAERELKRLRSRRSVRLALAAARPFKSVFRKVRAWKQRL